MIPGYPLHISTSHALAGLQRVFTLTQQQREQERTSWRIKACNPCNPQLNDNIDNISKTPWCPLFSNFGRLELWSWSLPLSQSVCPHKFTKELSTANDSMAIHPEASSPAPCEALRPTWFSLSSSASRMPSVFKLIFEKKNIDLDWRKLSVVIKVRFKNLISLRHAKNRILSLKSWMIFKRKTSKDSKRQILKKPCGCTRVTHGDSAAPPIVFFLSRELPFPPQPWPAARLQWDSGPPRVSSEA